MTIEEKNEFDESINNPHDAAFKSAFQKKELAQSFFKNYLSKKILRHIDLNYLKIVNKSYVDEKLREKHSDIAYETRIKGKSAFLYILFEHQSKPDQWMVFRVLCYMVNIWKEFLDQNPKAKLLPVIIPLVLYNGKRKWSSALKFTEIIDANEDLNKFLPDFSYTLFNLGTYEDERLQLGDYMALHVVLNLMKHIYDDDFSDILHRAMDILLKIKDETIFLEFLEWILRYAFHARNEEDENLKGIIDREAEKLGDERIRRSAMTIAERLRQQGLDEGKLKTISILLKLTKKRFGSVSPVLEEHLKQSDFDMLDKFGESIFDFNDIKDAEKWWDDQRFGSA